MNTETVAMTIIAHSGDARTLAFRALEQAKAKHYDEARDLMKQSEAAALQAHMTQTELLTSEANGEKTDINVLLIHSQDHLMTSLLAQELIKEIMELHETKADV